MTVSQTLAQFACSYTAEDSVRAVAKRHYLDTFACMAAGADTQTAYILAGVAEKNSREQTATILAAEGKRADSCWTAMVNSAAAHGRDFDDMCISLNGHASAVLVPVVTALGEETDAAFAEVLDAYIVGVEVDSLLGRLVNEGMERSYRKEWNTTCTLGIAGAVAAASRMLKLTGGQLAHALGIAVSESSCIKENYGTMAKDVSVGLTAYKAILTAKLAQAGIEASPKAFEGENGLFRAAGISYAGGELEKLLAGYKSELLTRGMVMKPYPTCRGNHNALDGINYFLGKKGIRKEEIRKIVCYVQKTAMDTDKYPFPQNSEQAKFSMRYCIGLILENGRIRLEDFKGRCLQRSVLERWMDRIELVEADERFAGARFGTEVELVMQNGKIASYRGEYAGGDPQNPLSAEEIGQKMADCLNYAFPGERGKELACLLEGMEPDTRIRGIMAKIGKYT